MTCKSAARAALLTAPPAGALQVTNAAKSAASYDAETWEAAAATLAAVVPAWLASGRSLVELLSSAVGMLPELAPTRRAPLLQAMLRALPAGVHPPSPSRPGVLPQSRAALMQRGAQTNGPTPG